MPGAPHRPRSSTAPGPATATTPGRSGRPSRVAALAAPATQTSVRREKRSTGPVSTASSPAARGGLPTARLANAKDRSSQAPEGGTPTSHMPGRPPRSCTVVCTPGESTSSTPRSNPVRSEEAVAKATTSSDASDGSSVVTGSPPAEQADRGGVPAVARVVQLRAVADQHQHVARRTHLHVLAGRGNAVGEGQSAGRGQRHVHEEVDVVPEFARADAVA